MWSSSPACRMGCGPTPFRAGECWPPSDSSTSWTASSGTPRCVRRCSPRSARLLVAAMGRARRRLLVTAVDSDTGGADQGAALPSPFFFEIAQWADDDVDHIAVQPVSAPRVLSTAALVGRLRGVVCAPSGAVDDAARHCAATQLARLASAGVPGADPSSWYGLTAVSTSDPLCESGDPVTLTPSTLQTLNDCPLRWLVERHGGTNPRELRSTIGSVLHALIAEPGKSEAQLIAELGTRLGAPAFRRSMAFGQRADPAPRHDRGVRASGARRRGANCARSASRSTSTGSLRRRAMTAVKSGCAAGSTGWNATAAGRLVIVDIKTGKTPVSKDDAQQHAQLADVPAGGGRRPGPRQRRTPSPTAMSPGARDWSTSARAERRAPPSANRIH